MYISRHHLKMLSIVLYSVILHTKNKNDTHNPCKIDFIKFTPCMFSGGLSKTEIAIIAVFCIIGATVACVVIALVLTKGASVAPAAAGGAYNVGPAPNQPPEQPPVEPAAEMAPVEQPSVGQPSPPATVSVENAVNNRTLMVTPHA